MSLIKLVTSSLNNLGIYLSRNAEQDIVLHIESKEPKIEKKSKPIHIPGLAEAERRIATLKKAEKFLADTKAKKIKASSSKDPLSKIRTKKENKVAKTYTPKIKVSAETAKILNVKAEELQALAELIETHIVASTIGVDGLKEADYVLDSKTFFTMIVGTMEGKTVYSPTIKGKRDKAQPYSYNFSEAYKIHSVFTNRYKKDRIVPNRNVVTLTIDTKDL